MAAPTDAVPPTDQEVIYYYDGLVSQPLLVARTSTTPFPPSPPALTELEASSTFPTASKWGPGALLKHLEPIGGLGRSSRSAVSASEAIGAEAQEQHEIVRVWCPALREALVAALDESPLAACWSVFYTVRVVAKWKWAPDRVLPTSAVVLLVGVDVTSSPESSLPGWEGALQAALACRNVLTAWGVSGVEVEVLTASIVGLTGDAGDAGNRGQSSTGGEESTSGTSSSSSTSGRSANLEALVNANYSATAISANFAEDASHTRERMHTFLDYPGQQLEKTLPTVQGNRPSGAWGSLGVYLGLAGSDDVFALTSRHVAVGDRLSSNQLATQDDHIPVLWGTQETLSARASLLRRTTTSMQSMAERLTRRLLRELEAVPDDDDNGNADGLEAEIDQRTWYANNYLPRLVDALDTLANNAPIVSGMASIPAERLLGYVAYAAPHGRTRRGAWNDWALVKLIEDRKKTVQGHKNANAVLLGRSNLYDFVHFVRNRIQLPDMPSPDELATVTTNGIVSLQKQVQDPSDDYTALDVHRPRWVAKRGARTGPTFGVTAELEAVFRRPFSDGTFVVAYALLVLDHRGDAYRFSRPGDSGAAVFGMEGEIVGLIDAGAGFTDEDPLLRFFHKPGDPGELPAETSTVETAARRAMAEAEGEQKTPPPGFKPLGVGAMPGQATTRSARVDVTFVTPIEWVFENIEEVTGKKVTVL